MIDWIQKNATDENKEALGFTLDFTFDEPKKRLRTNTINLVCIYVIYSFFLFFLFGK